MTRSLTNPQLGRTAFVLRRLRAHLLFVSRRAQRIRSGETSARTAVSPHARPRKKLSSNSAIMHGVNEITPQSELLLRAHP
jgi:hypothetical protein